MYVTAGTRFGLRISKPCHMFFTKRIPPELSPGGIQIIVADRGVHDAKLRIQLDERCRKKGFLKLGVKPGSIDHHRPVTAVGCPHPSPPRLLLGCPHPSPPGLASEIRHRRSHQGLTGPHVGKKRKTVAHDGQKRAEGTAEYDSGKRVKRERAHLLCPPHPIFIKWSCAPSTQKP